MKVKELLVKLARMNPETEVLVACDAEGNRFSVLTDIDEALTPKAHEAPAWDCTIRVAEELEPEELNDYRGVVILWPT